MKLLALPIFLICSAPSLSFAQSSSSLADSLAYVNPGRVLAFKNGDYVKEYPVGFRYPSSMRDQGIQGVMSFTLTLTEACNIRSIEFENSLGAEFETSIQSDAQQICKIYKTYKYQNCQLITITQSLNFDLGK